MDQTLLTSHSKHTQMYLQQAQQIHLDHAEESLSHLDSHTIMRNQPKQDKILTQTPNTLITEKETELFLSISIIHTYIFYTYTHLFSQTLLL